MGLTRAKYLDYGFYIQFTPYKIVTNLNIIQFFSCYQNVFLLYAEISNWSNWTECNATCGDGFQTRWCLNGTGYGCNGTRNESRKCPNLSPCPGNKMYLPLNTKEKTF